MFKLSKLKKFLPRSLFGRFLLIILLPNIIIQCFAVYIFYERHWDGVSRHMAAAFSGEISMLTKRIKRLDDRYKKDFISDASHTLYLDIEYFKNKKNNKITERHRGVDKLIGYLYSKLDDPFSVYYSDGKSRVVVDVQVGNDILRISSSKKRLANPSTYIFVMWMIGTAVIVLLISILFMRTQVRSITTLASVAEKFGKGKDTEKYKPSGATEVRMVGKAFIDMRERINKQIEQRTEMLAGVSHDLKTPLTRIKLQLAMMKQSKEVKDLQEDIIQMEKMVHDYLDFAKGKERVIDASVNIADLLRSVVSGYRHHHKNIELKVKSGVNLHVNANALRRVITNILDNALRYGKEVSIKMMKSQKNLIITIDDNGPGIPKNKRKDAFKPFNRLDSSRNMDGGNTGLGLAISKDIVVGYGGEITLDESQLGGLSVVIKLPLD